jgi:hypothetical protein
MWTALLVYSAMLAFAVPHQQELGTCSAHAVRQLTPAL